MLFCLGFIGVAWLHWAAFVQGLVIPLSTRACVEIVVWQDGSNRAERHMGLLCEAAPLRRGRSESQIVREDIVIIGRLASISKRLFVLPLSITSISLTN